MTRVTVSLQVAEIVGQASPFSSIAISMPTPSNSPDSPPRLLRYSSSVRYWREGIAQCREEALDCAFDQQVRIDIADVVGADVVVGVPEGPK